MYSLFMQFLLLFLVIITISSCFNITIIIGYRVVKDINIVSILCLQFLLMSFGICVVCYAILQSYFGHENAKVMFDII